MLLKRESIPRVLCAVVFAVLGGLYVQPAGAQQPSATLTLEEAIEIAENNNPDYLAAANERSSADWAVREAYGSFLPSANASTGFSYQGEGTPRFGVFTSEDIGLSSTPGYYSSDYSLSLGYGISGSDLFRVRQEKANRRATIADVEASRFALQSAVTQQYLTVSAADDAVELASSQLRRAEENLRLAQARVDVGEAIPLESMQADVERGRAEVELIRAENQLRNERLRLAQQLGIELEGALELTSDFEVFEPRWTQQELVSVAMRSNPQLQAYQARGTAADAGVRMAQSAYLPRFEASLGWSGYVRQSADSDFLVEQARSSMGQERESCRLLNQISAGLSEPLPGTPAPCDDIRLTQEQAQQIRESNEGFPFGFERQPLAASLRVSVPLFDGFGRKRQTEIAEVRAQNVDYQLRAEELRIRADVATAHDDLTTAARVVRIEEQNAETAAEQLRLARERYRLGATNVMELIDAETLRAEADRAYLEAVYSFHRALAILESTVGQELLQ